MINEVRSSVFVLIRCSPSSQGHLSNFLLHKQTQRPRRRNKFWCDSDLDQLGPQMWNLPLDYLWAVIFWNVYFKISVLCLVAHGKDWQGRRERGGGGRWDRGLIWHSNTIITHLCPRSNELITYSRLQMCCCGKVGVCRIVDVIATRNTAEFYIHSDKVMLRSIHMDQSRVLLAYCAYSRLCHISL